MAEEDPARLLRERMETMESRSARIQQVVDRLREALVCSSNAQRSIHPISSFGVGVWQPGDDVKLVATFDLTSPTFWLLFGERLLCDDDDYLVKGGTAGEYKTLPYSLPLLKDVQHLRATGTKFLLAHCGWPNTWLSVGLGDGDVYTYAERGRRLGPEGRRLNSIFEKNRLVEIFSTKRTGSDRFEPIGFRDAYNRIYAWASHNGLISADLGLLNCDCLLWLVAISIKPANVPSEHEQGNLGTDPLIWHARHSDMLVRDFFNYYKTSSLIRPMEIIMDSTPPVNHAEHVGEGGSRRIEAALKDRTPSAIPPSWPFRNPEAAALNKFLLTYDTYIVITARFWGQNPEKATDFQIRLERTIIPEWCRATENPRRILYPWPYPLQSANEDTSPPNTNLLYVIGTPFPPPIKEINAKAHSVLTRILKRTRDRISENFLNPTWEYQDVRLSTAYGLLKDENGHPLLLKSLTPASRLPPPPTDLPTPFASPLQQPAAPDLSNETAANVLHKLCWHPSLSHESYHIGYLDRFDGVLWKALESWRSAGEAEEEDWIPEHRIRAFRRRRDGVVVWERRMG